MNFKGAICESDTNNFKFDLNILKKLKVFEEKLFLN